MLIAVDSWPYIRGTLSPSPPGGPSGPGPQVVYPHVTPLCSATTTTVPPSRATTTPLWDRRPTLPLPYGYASREETLLSFFNERVSFFSSFARVPVRCLTSFFFFSSRRISSQIPWLRFEFYMILSLRNDGHTVTAWWTPFAVSEAADGTSIVSACLPSSGERPD